MIEKPLFQGVMVRAVAFHAMAAVLLCYVFFGSIWQSSYSMDPHHWGLMLSNAQDLCNHNLPYQDIFIQYGILTTAIQGFAFCTLGNNLQSLTLVTAAAYTLGLYLIYLLGIRLTGKISVSFYALAACVLIHPLIEYPWANYIAFPFLVLGLFLLVAAPARLVPGFLGGVSFGLAILSREGLAPAVMTLIFAMVVADLIRPTGQRWPAVFRGLILLAGSFLPIGLFFIYLLHHDLLSYWYDLSITLPRIYVTESFPYMGGVRLLNRFIRWIAEGFISLDPRRVLLLISLLVNALVVVLYLLGRQREIVRREFALVAGASLLLVSAALHLPEVFRLATGSAVGFVTLFALLNRHPLEKVFLSFFLGAMLPTIWSVHIGNRYFPYSAMIANAHAVITPAVFQGQRWPEANIAYYRNLASDFAELMEESPCEIKFHYNDTRDAFIAVLSPFKPYQVAPFVTGNSLNKLRPKLNLFQKLTDGDDIVVLRFTPNGGESIRTPSRFVVWKRYPAPAARYVGNGSDALEILVPERCVPPALSL